MTLKGPADGTLVGWVGGGVLGSGVVPGSDNCFPIVCPFSFVLWSVQHLVLEVYYYCNKLLACT